MNHRLLRLLAVLFAITLVAAACGDDGGTAADDTTDDTTAADDTAADDTAADDTAADDTAADDTAADDTAADDTAVEPLGDNCAAIADGGEGDLAGETVTILGPETAGEAEGFCASLQGIVDQTGVAIEYTGTRDATVQTNVAVEAGNEPSDIVMIPQPGRIAGFARDGLLTPIPQETLDGALADLSDVFLGFGTVDDTPYGIPVKADVKSFVWYSPSAFTDNGYEIPQTLDELIALQETMKGNGQTPWCIGIFSDAATGWVFTDWMEDLFLRFYGPDVYSQWPTHEINFDDERVKEVAEFVGDVWFDDSNVLGGRDSIATTGFRESILPLLDGECMMQRQAAFAGAWLTDDGGATLGTDGDANIFYFPVRDDSFGNVVLGGANIATAWNERPATIAVFDWMGSVEAAEDRIVAQGGGYTSPNGAVDSSVYPSDVDVTIADTLLNADGFGFDASDDMPNDVNAEFWQSGTDYVSGAIDVDTFLATVEAAWPEE